MMLNSLQTLFTGPNLLALATCLLLLEILRQQTLKPTTQKSLQNLLTQTSLTTKATALLVVSWSLLLAIQAIQTGNPSQIAAACLLGCLTSLGLQIHTLRKTTHHLARLIMEETIAIISLAKDKSQEIHLWFKKSGAEWPPVQIHISESHITRPVTSCSPKIREKISQLIQKTNAFKNKEFQSDLKKTLHDAGVTHPMDIEGNQSIREIQNFLEETLLNPTPTKP
jgi:hypothetical protein